MKDYLVKEESTLSSTEKIKNHIFQSLETSRLTYGNV